jgi:SAM-dependent methyltransferase
VTPRALAAWAGTIHLSELALHRGRLGRLPITAASAPLACFVAGVDVPRRMLGDWARFADGDPAHARVALLPLGPSLLICDRGDAALAEDLACWPDDSSYHLAHALPPGRRASWLDVGCGSGFQPLYRPELAGAITGIDVNPRAAAFARHGAELCRVPHLTVVDGDVGDARGRFELVTCNAPIPGMGITRWRHTDASFFDRLWDACLRCATDLVVVHAVLPALLAAPAVGERAVVAYTPEDVHPGFGVLWWRPHAPERTAFARRLLTIERPHLDARDLDAVIPSLAAWGS